MFRTARREKPCVNLGVAAFGDSLRKLRAVSDVSLRKLRTVSNDSLRKLRESRPSASQPHLRGT
jgi:hypothetical protein